MSRSLWLRGARITCGLYLAACLVAPGGARAAAPTDIGVIAGSSAASGLHALYTPQGLIPTAALVDLGVPDALTTISTGPSTFARASVADPGEVLANPDALFAQSGGGYEPGTVPPYPYRASASSSVGEPEAESSPAPGLGARVEALPMGSTAFATMPGADGAAVATVGSMTSRTSTTTDGATVTVRARSEISGFSLLGGLLTIESVVIDLTATSDGTTTTTSGGTTITGAAVAGTPVVIDDNGVRTADPSGPSTDGPAPVLDPLNGALDEVLSSGIPNLNEQLAAAGVRVAAVEPTELGTGTARERTANGVRIELALSSATVPAVETLLESLPYVAPLAPGFPGLSDVIAVARARQLVGLDLGRARVTLDARPRTAPPARPAGGTATRSPSATAPPGLSLAPPIARPAGDGTGPLEAAPASTQPDLPLGAGIGALALLGLIVVPFVGDRLGAAAGWVLPPGASDHCPLEGS